MFAIVGLILGIALGIYLEPILPAGLQPYLPIAIVAALDALCLLYTSPSPRDRTRSRMPSSA